MEPFISIRGARKVFGKLEALRGVDLEVAKGEVVLVIGPSGSGKSTLLRAVNRLERLDGGSIQIDGESVTEDKADIRRIREEVGMVFQSFNLFPHLSVIQNITLSPISVLKMSKDKATELGRRLLLKVGLSEKEYAYPDQLSGGQMMSAVVALRLALLQTIGARVAFFDEPTSNLDASRRENLAHAFRAIDVGREEVTEHWYDQLFLVSHDVAFTEITDKVIEL